MSVAFRRAAERAILIACAGALAIVASPAAACSLRLGPVQTTPIAYDPFAATTDGVVRVEIQLADGTECTGDVRLEDMGGAAIRTLRFGDGQGPEFGIELLTSAGVQPSVDPAGASVRLSGADARVWVEWRVKPIRDSLILPGDYALPLQVSGAGSTFEGGPSPGTLDLRSIARAQVNLAGGAGRFASGSDAFTIDLGDLVGGRTGRAFLQVRANTPSRISIQSAHRGFLANEADASLRVPYSMTVDSRPVDLAGLYDLPVPASLTLDGASLPILVTIGDVRGALAGRYSDTVTIDISP